MADQPEKEEDRLRPPPTERFAGDSHHFDLGRALRKLRAEEHEAKRGHHQITLYRRAPVTHILFSFETGGRLEEHTTNGLVNIQVLEGRLRVGAEGEVHEMDAGQVLILNPGIPHDVEASEPSAMLLTVHLEKGGKGPDS
jgi:quercetin dioxygenase-like cupin family protein